MNKNLAAKILMVLLPIIVLVVAIFLIQEIKKREPATTGKISEGTPTPTPETRQLSRWATDSGILKIEGELRGLVQEIDNVNLQETSLVPPILDMKVKF